jgi:hydroxymethylpyrimidine/phosphomethylpyrimidine kinase
MSLPIALTIAGSDPSGGAGLQADLKTFHAHGCYGCSVITLLTVQNTRGVSRVALEPTDLVLEQLHAVTSDVPPAATKTGALGSAALISALAGVRETIPGPLVVDPVMVSKGGDPLLPDEALEALRDELLPRADLLTPNLFEARKLTGLPLRTPDEAREAVDRLLARGARAVYLKGAAFAGDSVVDLYGDREGVEELLARRQKTRSLHGTGCVLSAAITARLARGHGPREACRLAHAFVQGALERAPNVGGGIGPIDTLTRPADL